eukprot:CAMPEP_0178981296 /NCGR_PEP_ID=MMETSP0789-20121207/26982_1 /TAXON_ID=3005 /ORGANISM="Rhizosolenia setigera, Strain CCMP 1694" /LENGTH=1337 /DNA_ID=CAMNT_0020671823 /DNA_START=365 /DNA_END=4378 /DNA_ORIENTATION=-
MNSSSPHSSSHHRHNRREGTRGSGGSLSGYHRQNSRGSSSGGGSYHGRSGPRNNNNNDVSNLPREEGCIISLLESFGFIKCAERNEEVFFHFSEVNDVDPTRLEIGQEVVFSIGPSPKSNSKIAAFRVNTLPPGTVVWEVEDKERSTGKIERGLSRQNNNNNNSNFYEKNSLEGTIKLLQSDSEENDDDDNENRGQSPPQDNMKSSSSSVFVKFTKEDYKTEKGSSAPSRLMKGDLVEFTIVTERRTGKKFAREITIIQTEKERLQELREEKLLANATTERGVVTLLLENGGYLRSSSRREPVYFQYSEVELPEGTDSNDVDAGDNEHHLKVGQDMEFTVCDENFDGRFRGEDRFTARNIKFLPLNTVEFFHLIASGKVGTVTQIPIPVVKKKGGGFTQQQTPTFSGKIGKVSLETPIITVDNETVKEVSIYAEDCPGGIYSANRDGSQVGIWIKKGDKILFDVVKETMDGSFRAAKTTCMAPVVEKKKEEHPNDSLVEKLEEEEEENQNDDNEGSIRLIQPFLAGRVQGVISAMKEGFGFITLAERNIDVYFRSYEIFPNSIQCDIIQSQDQTGKQQNYSPNSIPKLTVGTHVTFDLCLSPPERSSRSKHSSGGRHHHEKENLKGQRIAFLPKGHLDIDTLIAEEVRGVVSQEHNDGSGFIELETGIKGMTPEERHPLVAQLLDQIISTDEPVEYPNALSISESQVILTMAEAKGLEVSFVGGSTGESSIDPLVSGYAKLKISPSKSKSELSGSEQGANDVSDSNLPESSSPVPESDCVSIGSSTNNNNGGTEIVVTEILSPPSKKDTTNKPSTSKKKRPKRTKPVKVIRFERSAVSKGNTGGPPGLGDTVTCTITQSRRTGAYSAINVNVVERKMIERKAPEAETSGHKSLGISGFGIVSEVVSARNFGFISLLDENAVKKDMLYFQLSSVSFDDTIATQGTGDTDPGESHNSRGNSKRNSKNTSSSILRKGDEVRFDIGKNEKNGKSIALNVVVVPQGTLKLPTKHDKTASQGYILMEPVHTSLSNTPVRKTSFGGGLDIKPGGNGRWSVGGSSAIEKFGTDLHEEGCILLVSDPSGQFSKGKSKIVHTTSDENKSPESAQDSSTNNTQEESSSESESLFVHLKYRNGALAIRGAGSSDAPHRGDLVSFVKGKGSCDRAKDIRIVKKAAATMKKGALESLDIDKGTAMFVTFDGDKKESYEFKLTEVVSCDVKLLKEKINLEAVVHEGKVYGVCRTTDLRLESKVSSKTSKGERPRLNLTVKSELQTLGGKIVAQTGMAQGPNRDGSIGFVKGWTTRVSLFACKNDDTEEEAPTTSSVVEKDDKSNSVEEEVNN